MISICRQSAAIIRISSSRNLISRRISNEISMAATDSSITGNLANVLSRVKEAAEKLNRGQTIPRLVAVSKTKPVDAIMEAYNGGQRTFGENYAQEIIEKAPLLPKDIEWHFIGHLQTNKAKALLDAVPNLAMIETVDSTKLADKLNKQIEGRAGRSPLRVMVQVNTSGEESKYGVEPGQVVELAKHIQQLRHLELAGLMTIGQPDYSSRPENFVCLAECRDRVSKELGIAVESLELSMGMSGDFEQAIAMGSTNIRVGSTIFGAR